MRHLLGLVAVLLLASCLSIGATPPTPTPITAISLEEAERIAIETGSHGQPEIAPMSSTPQVLQAELITLKEAFDRQNTSVPLAEAPETLVWYIELDGLWKDAYPRLAADPTPESFPHLVVMIDSHTGFVYLIGTHR